MPLLRKVVRVLVKTLVGIAAFYLFLTLVVVPVVVPLVVRSQATKILKTPVNLRSVTVNPFLLRVTAGGMAVMDREKQVMAGFDRFSVDLSFLGLLRKEYRIESVLLKGLTVTAVLGEQGTVNLLDLVPAQTPGEAAKQSPAPPVPNAGETGESGNDGAGQPPAKTILPLVIVDRMAVSASTLRFIDRSVKPEFSTVLKNIDVLVTGFSTRPDSRTHVACRMQLDDTGTIEIETELSPFIQPLRFETAFSMSNYGLKILTPYVGKFTGRAVGSGKLDVKMNYRVAENTLTASHKVLVQKFDFGEKVESPDALNLPFGLAVALLEDPQGRISISLPVTGDMSDPEFKYLPLVGQVVRNFFIKLVTKPFSFIASAMGLAADTGTEEMGSILFPPGKSLLAEEERAKLSAFAGGVKERPKLSLAVNGTYDPAADWQAVKTEAFENDYNTLRQGSKLSEKWIYHTLYARRFGFRSLWTLTRAHRVPGGYDQEAINAEIRRRIIDDAAPDTAVLQALAGDRAKQVYDIMIGEGLPGDRVRIGESKQVQSSFGKVPLEFTFTVFEQPADDPESASEAAASAEPSASPHTPS